jgi:hypothetical protein
VQLRLIVLRAQLADRQGICKDFRFLERERRATFGDFVRS